MRFTHTGKRGFERLECSTECGHFSIVEALGGGWIVLHNGAQIDEVCATVKEARGLASMRFEQTKRNYARGGVQS